MVLGEIRDSRAASAALAFWVCVLYLFPLGCKPVNDRREALTFANLQPMAFALTHVLKEKGTVSRQDFDEHLPRYFQEGKDPWGQLIIFVPATSEGGSNFLLISTGRDRALDVEKPEDYRDFEPQQGESTRPGQDIVMRGRTALRYGAHK